MLKPGDLVRYVGAGFISPEYQVRKGELGLVLRSRDRSIRVRLSSNGRKYLDIDLNWEFVS